MLSADFFSMMTYYSSHTENEVYYYHSVLCGNRAQSHVCLSYAEMQQSVRSKHLGSTAYLTNDSGQVSQVLNYLPYGEDWVEIHNITTFDTTRLGMYRFNGKEKDYESGFHYYGARYYWSELLTGWLSVDPMSDKAWNPVKLVDPDGKEIVIKDGQKTYYYINGHVYTNSKGRGGYWDSRLGKEANKIKGNLDKMLKDKAGAKVVGRLTNSKKTYTIAADAQTGDGSYNHCSKKVSLVSGKGNNLGSLSHELFHAYQDDNGRTPHTVYNEVEAYVFSGVIYGASLGITSTTDMNYNEKGVSFAKSLKVGRPFNSDTFQYLLDNFKKCSTANWNGDYNSYPKNPGNYKASESLLNGLF